MRITREVDYALRIVFMLSREQKQIEAKVISEQNGIPYRFTLKILRKIVQAGIIRSYRGVNGGYILNCKPSEISMLDVIECIDGDLSLNRCGEDNCVYKGCAECAINSSLHNIQDKLKQELKNVTFDKMLLDYQVDDTGSHGGDDSKENYRPGNSENLCPDP